MGERRILKMKQTSRHATRSEQCPRSRMLLPAAAFFCLLIAGCEKIDLQINPKGFTSGRCLNNAGQGPESTSPYQNQTWSDEFNGMEPGEDPGCYSRTPTCAVRLDWPGHGETCPAGSDFTGLQHLNKCKWKVWAGYSTWDIWPKATFAYQPSQVAVRNGSLVLSVKHRTPPPGAKCGIIPGADPGSGGYYGIDCEWLSGGIDSAQFGSFLGRNIRNGRIEMRAKLPAGEGAYPALWTWAAPAGSGWPYSMAGYNPNYKGEYDLLEAVTKSAGMIQAFQTYHEWQTNPDGHKQAGSGTIYLNPGTWYRFGVERFPGKTRFYVDDCYTHEVKEGDKGIRFNDYAQYFIMNLALERDAVVQGRAAGMNGKSLEVDYVRIFE
jgi:hypothetical protein